MPKDPLANPWAQALISTPTFNQHVLAPGIDDVGVLTDQNSCPKLKWALIKRQVLIESVLSGSGQALLPSDQTVIRIPTLLSARSQKLEICYRFFPE